MLIRIIKSTMRRKHCYVVVVSVCVFLKILYILSNFKEVPDQVVLRSYENDFHYPLDVDLKPLVADIFEERLPSVQIINFYSHDFIMNSNLCLSSPEIDLIIAVRSAIDHFDRRDAVRKTYGRADLVRGKVVRTLFFVGTRESESFDNKIMQSHLEREMELYNDIIQASFLDYYFLNTIKTMTIFRWLYEYCPNANFCLITEDDMYISPANLLRYLDSWEAKVNMTGQQDRRLLAGNVFPRFQPQRIPEKRWYISLEAYPWDGGPPFAEAGAFVMSAEAYRVIFVASLFVRHLVYDDVYIGIVAHKIGLPLTHCPKFHFYKKKYTQSGFRDVIACQGFKNPKKRITVWNKQNKLS